jgi:hypothetical protein
MNSKLIAAAAALTLVAGSAFAAAPNYGATTPPVSQTRTGDVQTDPSTGLSVYQPNLAANPGETPHQIGGQTFYYNGSTANSISSDGAAN